MAAIDPDELPKKKIIHEMGQDLALLSVAELTEAQRCPGIVVARAHHEPGARGVRRVQEQFLRFGRGKRRQDRKARSEQAFFRAR